MSGSTYVAPNNQGIVTNTEDGYFSWSSRYISGSNYVRSIFANSGNLWLLDPSGAGDSFSYNFTTNNWVIPSNTILNASPIAANNPANKAYVDNSIDSAISGATGTFTSQDGKTITVTNGLITNISTP